MDSSSDEDLPLADLLPLGQLKKNFGSNKTETVGNNVTANEIAVMDSDCENSMSSDYHDDSDADPLYKPGLCHVKRCKEDIFAACGRCDLLLCYDHFTDDTDVCEHDNIKKCKEMSMSGSPETEDFVAVGSVVVPVPEAFTVEGAPKEVLTKKVPRKNKYREAKEKRNCGEEYVRPKTKIRVDARKIGKGCVAESCLKFGRQCGTIAMDQREEIFRNFYALGDLELQREFLVRHIDCTHKKASTTGSSVSRRQMTKTYYLTTDGNRLKVCQKMFLNTLGISEKTARTAIKKKLPTGAVEGEKRGGRRAVAVQRDEAISTAITAHISRFPTVESHYCRSSSSKQYLHPTLNIPKMYRMFTEEYVGQDTPSFASYSRIFKKMNLGFHRPKKDQCSLCLTYRTGDEETKEKLNDRFHSHMTEKTKVRQLKEESKQRAKHDDGLLAATFDLQQVIYLPISHESAIFYKRRLSNYNMTFYNLADRHCHCYTWHEGESKRGSSEITTAVYKALQHYDKSQRIKEVHLFADGCPGQNKNSIMPTMLLYMVNTSTNIKEISIKFFETAHGQNEGDAVHSTIGTAVSRAGDVFVPTQLTTIMKLARPTKPYQVIPLQYEDFLDFKKLSVDLRILNVRRDSESDEVINWNNVMELRVNKNHPATIFYKNSHAEETFKTITLKRQKNQVRDFPLVPLNKEQPKVPAAKYTDLVSLCQGDTPIVKLKVHKDFFLSLPHD